MRYLRLLTLPALFLLVWGCKDNDDDDMKLSTCPSAHVCLATNDFTWVQDNISELKTFAVGKTRTEVLDKVNQSLDGALYMFAMDMDGLMLANPGFPDNVSKNLYNLKDEYTGRFLVQDMINTAKKSAPNDAWSLYYYKDPFSKKITQKFVLLTKMTDANGDYIVAAGAYVE